MCTDRKSLMSVRDFVSKTRVCNQEGNGMSMNRSELKAILKRSAFFLAVATAWVMATANPFGFGHQL